MGTEVLTRGLDLSGPDFAKVRVWQAVPNRLSFYSRKKIRVGDVLLWQGRELKVTGPVSRGSVCILSTEPNRHLGKYYCELKFKFL